MRGLRSGPAASKAILQFIRQRRSSRFFRIIRATRQKPLVASGLYFLTAVILIALMADFIASDKPLVAVLDGKLHILPSVIHNAELLGVGNLEIQRKIAAGRGWAIFPPIPFGPNQTNTQQTSFMLSGPSRIHWLGTDASGRDVLARLIHGARTAVIVGAGSVVINLLVGMILGALAAYFGGLFDRSVLRIIETFSSFPTFFLIIALQGLIGTTTVWQLALLIGIARWTDVARLTRAEVLRVTGEDFIASARALGLRHVSILRRHVLPNAMGPVMVAATFGVAGAIMVESTLSFLGIGAPEPTASWGQLMTDGFLNPGSYWLTMFPGILLSLTIISINLVGEGIQDAVDPSK